MPPPSEGVVDDSLIEPFERRDDVPGEVQVVLPTRRRTIRSEGLSTFVRVFGSRDRRPYVPVRDQRDNSKRKVVNRTKTDT